jgi:serine phosphatase RsbU (regulator of sigma subunit)
MAAVNQADEVTGLAPLEWAWAGAALDLISGDLHVVVPFEGGALAALVDGLGHGEEAAMAAEEAEKTLRRHAGMALPDLVRACHEDLRRTRGVVLSIASFDFTARALTWTGVGNVEAALLRSPDGQCAGLADAALLARGGIVGYMLPALRLETLEIGRGDLLVMATDGIRAGHADDLDRTQPAQAVARDILARHARADDDARVLVVRFLGDGA